MTTTEQPPEAYCGLCQDTDTNLATGEPCCNGLPEEPCEECGHVHDYDTRCAEVLQDIWIGLTTTY